MRIKINPLNPDSIDSAIAKIEAYRKSLGEKNERIIKRLVEIGVEYAKGLAPEVAGDITSEIQGSGKETKGIIRASDEAVFVEFGTGARGYANPYPKKQVMESVKIEYNGFTYTDYMSGPKIFKTKDGRIGWIAPIGDGGKYVFTEGVYSKAFMYFTGKYLKEIAPKVAKEVLKNG